MIWNNRGMAAIAVVEDDPKTATAVAEALRLQGHDVKVATTVHEGTALVLDRSMDVLILDWMLPDGSGLELLKAARQTGHTPVLLLTAKDAIEDRVLGLESGADDYLVKPFALAELVARLRALLRRAEIREVGELCVADLTLELRHRVARRATKQIALTPREFDVLHCLMRNVGQVVTREMLAREVWRDVPRATPLDNVIDVHLTHLRRKLDDGQTHKLLKTIRGVGYTLCGMT
jgi:two-component system copper resistance phosphate regulon response regulator CusR